VRWCSIRYSQISHRAAVKLRHNHCDRLAVSFRLQPRNSSRWLDRGRMTQLFAAISFNRPHIDASNPSRGTRPKRTPCARTRSFEDAGGALADIMPISWRFMSSHGHRLQESLIPGSGLPRHAASDMLSLDL
jgi:hypothetical protein